MHIIIPDTISPDQHQLAAALVAGAGIDPSAQAAVGLLLRLHPDTLLRTQAYTVGAPRAQVRMDWRGLASATSSDRYVLTPSWGETQLILAACAIASTEATCSLAGVLAAVDTPTRRAVAEAVAHAAGIPPSPDWTMIGQLRGAGEYQREEQVTGEPLPAGVQGVPCGTRCLRCGGRRQPCPTCGYEEPAPVPAMTTPYARAVLEALRVRDMVVTGYWWDDTRAITRISMSETQHARPLWPAVGLWWRPEIGWHLLPDDDHDDDDIAGARLPLGLPPLADPSVVADRVTWALHEASDDDIAALRQAGELR